MVPLLLHFKIEKNSHHDGPEIMPKMHFKAKSSVNLVSEQKYTHLGSSWKFF